MSLSKRLALLGVRSASSVSKSRGFSSSYSLVDCRRRPFPYRQIFDFTKDSSPSKSYQIEALEEDSSPTYLIEVMKARTVLLDLVEKDRAEVEKMRTELARAGFIYRRPMRFSDVYDYSLMNYHYQKHQLTAYLPGEIKYQAEREKNRKLRAELDELAAVRSDLRRAEMDIAFNKTMKKLDNWLAEDIREFRASTNDSRIDINIFGTAFALFMPVVFLVALLNESP